MASTLLVNHPRTIVVQKPRKTFGSFLVAKNSNTPYSDATKVTRLSPSEQAHWRALIAFISTVH